MLPVTNTILVSDIHIGSEVSRAKACQALLETYRDGRYDYRFRRLILLGDIFDRMDLKRIRKWEWNFLGLVREIGDPDTGVEVVWVRGNHDPEVLDLLSNLVGARAYEHYLWQLGSRKFFAIHGDQFDRWMMVRPKWAVAIPEAIYYAMQKIDGPHNLISRYIKEKSKRYLRLNEEVSNGAVRYVRDHHPEVSVILCGHTHMADERHFLEWDITYYNIGCWTGRDSPTYATVNELGEVEVLDFSLPEK